jgi:hypothetical protein
MELGAEGWPLLGCWVFDMGRGKHSSVSVTPWRSSMWILTCHLSGRSKNFFSLQDQQAQHHGYNYKHGGFAVYHIVFLYL